MRESCALTGHRVLEENFNTQQLFGELEALIRAGTHTFFCGMAKGFDLLALRLLVELKERYPIYIEACIPFEGQERNFSDEEKALYYDLLKKCDRQTVLCKNFSQSAFFTRNRYMVDCADFVFAYCNTQSGGTFFTVTYALKKGKEVIYFKNIPA